MFIDFLGHFVFSNNNITKNNPQIVHFKQNKDTFIKSIPVNSTQNSAFDEITISKKGFGNLENGQETSIYTIKNKNGASVDLSDFGATIVAIKIPDKNGIIRDVTQGYNNVKPYETSPVGHAGGTIGPCANKISNGEFSINGKKYNLEKNKDNGQSHCHGGSRGLDVKLWKAKVLSDGINFSYLKKDLENGYPGNVEISVTYKFDNNNNLHIIYDAKTDADTLLNLTNHTYFNLDGENNTGENSVLEHYVKLPNSSKITENNSLSIPTGKFIDVENSPFDFRKFNQIKNAVNENSEQLKIGSGFDHNYCVDGYDGKSLIDIAEVKSEKTGILLKVSSNLPGFQFYTANHLGKNSQPAGKSGTKYEKRSALCIEPQFYPNAINTEEFNENGILRKGEKYQREIVYSFSTEN